MPPSVLGKLAWVHLLYFVILCTELMLHDKHWLVKVLLCFVAVSGVVDVVIYELPVCKCYIQGALPGYEVLRGRRASRPAAHLAHLSAHNGDQGREEGTKTRLFRSVRLWVLFQCWLKYQTPHSAFFTRLYNFKIMHKNKPRAALCVQRVLSCSVPTVGVVICSLWVVKTNLNCNCYL